MKIKLLLVGIALSLVGACGGDSGGSPMEETDPQTGDYVNGYHMVGRTAYDEFDRVLSVLQRTANYDQNNLSTIFTAYDMDGNVDFESEFLTFYDEFGRLVRDEYSNATESDTTIYGFNATGLLQSASRDGERAYNMSFEYDSADRLASKHRDWIRDGEVSSAVDYTYSYNDEGLLASAKQVENEPADPFTGAINRTTVVSTYLHDNQGRITRSEKITSTNTLGNSSEFSLVSDFTYDQNGNVVEEIVTELSTVTRYEYTYELSEEPIFNTWLRRFKYFP